MRFTSIPGIVPGTAVEVSDHLDDPDEPCVLVETRKIDDGDPSLDRAGATRLMGALYTALHGSGTVDAIARVDKPIRARVARGDYIRAGGDAVCTINGCGFALREHPEVRGFPTLHIRCDGQLVKL